MHDEKSAFRRYLGSTAIHSTLAKARAIVDIPVRRNEDSGASIRNLKDLPC
jgi:hypothetical protein